MNSAVRGARGAFLIVYYASALPHHWASARVKSLKSLRNDCIMHLLGGSQPRTRRRCAAICLRQGRLRGVINPSDRACHFTALAPPRLLTCQNRKRNDLFTHSMSTDVELTLQEKRRGGYTAAAEWLARDVDNETLVFRKFDKLAALNLLYLQSEILDLENSVEKMHQDAVANGSDLDLQETARRWETFVKQATEGDPRFRQDARAKMQLVWDLRAKIKEYRK